MLQEGHIKRLWLWLRFWISWKQKMVSQLCYFYKCFKTPWYLFHVTRNEDKLHHLKVKQLFQNYFFFLTVIEWNNQDLNNTNFESLSIFKVTFWNSYVLLNRILFKPKGIQLLTRLRLALSHLREHKLQHNFQDTFNWIWDCGEDIETSCYHLLHW